MCEAHTASHLWCQRLDEMLVEGVLLWQTERIPKEETEGREPVGRRREKKTSQCWIQTITRPPCQAFYSAVTLLNNKLLKYFIAGASWDLQAGFGSSPK